MYEFFDHEDFYMTYSVDIRARAVARVNEGMQRCEVARLFGLTTRTLYNWMKAGDLHPKKHGSRQGKIDKAALKAHVRDNPDATLHERAVYFGVHINAIWSALKKMNIVKKELAVPSL